MDNVKKIVDKFINSRKRDIKRSSGLNMNPGAADKWLCLWLIKILLADASPATKKLILKKLREPQYGEFY